MNVHRTMLIINFKASFQYQNLLDVSRILLMSDSYNVKSSLIPYNVVSSPYNKILISLVKNSKSLI